MTDVLPPLPDVGQQPSFSPPLPQIHTLSGGLAVWVLPAGSLPLVSLRLIVPGGSMADPPGKAGLGQLTDDLLLHGAGERSAAEFAALSERLAIDIAAEIHDSATAIQIDVTRQHLDTALELLADAVLRPTFDEDELAVVLRQQQGSVAQGLDEPDTVSGWVVQREYFGGGHPLAHPTDGTLADLSSITRQDVVDSWRARYANPQACLVLSGDVDDEVLHSVEEHLGSWKLANAQRTEPEPPSRPTGTQHVFLDQPGSTQSILYVVAPGIPAKDERLQTTMLGVMALGGTFTSRLNRLLREEKGYTYGARSWVDAGLGVGTIRARTAVQSEVTAAALSDLLSELERIRLGITAEELDKALAAKKTNVIEGFASRHGTAQIYATLFEDGRGPTALAEGLTRMEATTLQAVNTELAALDLDHALVLVAGDLEAIREDVEAAVPGPWHIVEP